MPLYPLNETLRERRYVHDEELGLREL